MATLPMLESFYSDRQRSQQKITDSNYFISILGAKQCYLTRPSVGICLIGKISLRISHCGKRHFLIGRINISYCGI